MFFYHVNIIKKQNWECILPHPSLRIFEWCDMFHKHLCHKPGSKILRRILSPSWDSKERPTSVANKQIFTMLVLIKDSNTYMPKNRTHFSYRFRIYVSHSMLMTFLGSFLLDKHCIFFFLFLKNFLICFSS